MSAGLQMLGFDELEKKLINLQKLGGKPNRVINAAGRKAWQPVAKAAQARILAGAYRTGALMGSVIVTVKRNVPPGAVHVSGLKIKSDRTVRQVERAMRKLKIRGGAQAIGIVNPRRYWHIIEFGAPNRGIRPLGYIRGAFASNLARLEQTFGAEMGKGVKRALDSARVQEPGEE
jgi:hypothetical protein